MSRLFEELDYQQTPIGVISLRRRLEPSLKIDVFEIKIGEDGLMSSLITDGEEAVSSLALAASAWATPRRPCSRTHASSRSALSMRLHR